MKGKNASADAQPDVKSLRRRISELEAACQRLAQAEEGVRANEQSEHRFREQLTLLQEVTNELSQAETVDDLCHQAVELGRNQLGFDRLGIGFVSDEPGVLAGSFGTDEQGRVRDERQLQSHPPKGDLMAKILDRSVTHGRRLNVPIVDLAGRSLGKVDLAAAGIWDGEKVIGVISVDNLTGHKEITEDDCELLRLYATAVGHLCKRIRIEEAGRSFRKRLTVLQEVTNKLARTDDFDVLCKHVIELGRASLGFDRLGLWFTTDEPGLMGGTFGTDEDGNLRDERERRYRCTPTSEMGRIVRGETPFIGQLEAVVRDGQGNVVGRTHRVTAGVWDGRTVIGCLGMDNYLNQEEITDDDCELLRLYAAAVGHLSVRLRAGRALRESEEQARWILESTSDGIHIAEIVPGRGWQLVMCNDRYVEISGRSREELMAAKDISPFIHTGHSPEKSQEIQDRLDRGEPAQGQSSWRRPDGKENYQEWTATHIQRDGRKFVIGINRDVTKRVLAERALREQEERQRVFHGRLAAMQEASIELSRLESFDDLCRQAVELGRTRLGFDRMSLWFLTEDAELVQGSFGTDEDGNTRDERGIRSRVTPDSTVDRLLKKRIPFAAEADIPAIDAEGGIVGQATVAADALWDGEEIIGYISADNLLRHEEITAEQCELLRLYAATVGHLCSRLRAAEALRASEDQMRLILDNTTDGIHIAQRVAGVGWQLVMCNDRYAEMSGRSREELLAARDISGLIATENTDEEERELRDRLSRGAPARGRSSWIRPDGRENYQEWTATHIHREGRTFVIGINRDITEYVLAERALQESEERERAFREQLTILHEVTTELSGAESFDELCRQAVVLGCERLGFERMSMWFTSADDSHMIGSYGVDEQGGFRDERHMTIKIQPDSEIRRILNNRLPLTIQPDVLHAGPKGRTVGRATVVHAALWDGEEVIGYLSTDTLFSGADPSEDRCELQRMYASALGHLCSQKRAQQALREGEERERSFRELLTALHEATVELSMTESMDELCRQAVELGRSRLGFDRLSVWLVSEDGRERFGTYGVDPDGRIRDEHDRRMAIDRTPQLARMLRTPGMFLRSDGVSLRDEPGGPVLGTVTNVLAGLWDGARMLGYVSTDNLVRQEEITDHRCELLRLYASVIGHLCTRRRAEEELVVRNSAIESAINAMALADLEGKITYVNPAFLRLWGFDSPEEVVGRSSVEFWRSSDRAQEVVERLRTHGGWIGELTGVRKDGAEFDVAVSASIVTGGGGEPVCSMASFVDVTERKRGERAVRVVHHKLLTAREEERRRLARELHDSIGQGLVALRMTMQAALGGLAESERAADMEQTLTRCDALVREVRDICRGLYPATLESMGLELALQQLASDFRTEGEVTVAWDRRRKGHRLPAPVEIALFRIAQEAVSNAVRHGRADKVEVALDWRKSIAEMVIADDGSGFDVDGARGKGLGLTTMQERAEAVGGELEITSEPGRTHVTVHVPTEPVELEPD